jgi:hypothetical protein
LSIGAERIDSVLKRLTTVEHSQLKNDIQNDLRSFQVIKYQYNQLITKKPFSFVAKINGHQKI